MLTEDDRVLSTWHDDTGEPNVDHVSPHVSSLVEEFPA